MADSNGRFVWYELMTTDLAAARAFYDTVVGWSSSNTNMPGMEYWMFKVGDSQAAGLMSIPEEAAKMGARPQWTGYVEVADVDAAAALVTANGGAVYQQPSDIPDVGRFAIIADPAGAALALFHSAHPEMDQPASMEEPGRVGWNELYGADPATGFDFYAKLFGWQKQQAMDMGDMGPYQMFGFGEMMLGGMMKLPPNVPTANWTYYFNVGNIDEAAERVKAAGGQVVAEPMEVPGGGWVLRAADPQGAGFALIGRR